MMYRNLSTGAIGVKASFVETCRLAATNGFSGVDLAPAAVEEAGSVEAAAELLKSHSLRVGSWRLPFRWLGDENEFKSALHDVKEHLRQGQELGVDRVTIVVFSWSDDRPYEENFQFHVARYKPVAELLGAYGFKIAFEFLGPKTLRAGKKHEFIHTLDGCMELCDAVGENCGVLLDAWHWYTSHGTLDEVRQLPPEKVVYIHVNDAPAGIPIDEQIDNVRCLPGETGVIDLVGLLSTLRSKGCDAPVTVEPFSARVRQMTPDEAVRATAESLERVWSEAGL